MDRMPMLFIGHGSPMNAIEDNVFSAGWTTMGRMLPRPRAILVVSAHWYTEGTRVMTQSNPKQIYDFFGFPKALYQLKYPVAGYTEGAQRVLTLLEGVASADENWGIDHGAWSVLTRLFPEGDIPVFQMSIDNQEPPERHYELGKKLAVLRDEGVMIIGSGNVVHSFRGASFEMSAGHPWAYTFDNYIHDCIVEGNHQGVIAYNKADNYATKAFETPDHYYPLLYVLGAVQSSDTIRVFNRACVYGGFSMTSYYFEV